MGKCDQLINWVPFLVELGLSSVESYSKRLFRASLGNPIWPCRRIENALRDDSELSRFAPGPGAQEVFLKDCFADQVSGFVASYDVGVDDQVIEQRIVWMLLKILLHVPLAPAVLPPDEFESSGSIKLITLLNAFQSPAQ